MTEETKPVVAEGDAQKQESTTQQEPQYTEIEQKALDMGWRPKEDFQGDEEDFIDAKEFVRRKPLFDKIEHTSKELKEFKKAFNALKTHYTTVRETEYSRALAKLQEAREEAITNSDGAAFTAIDNQIRKVEHEKAQMEQVKQDVPEEPAQVHPELAAWINKNNWYQSVNYMRKWADDYGLRLHQEGKTPSEVLKMIEQGVRKEFPQKFTNPNKASAPDVEDGNRPRGGGKKDSFELSEQETKIMNTLVRQGVLTKEKYLEDLRAIKGIKK